MCNFRCITYVEHFYYTCTCYTCITPIHRNYTCNTCVRYTPVLHKYIFSTHVIHVQAILLYYMCETCVLQTCVLHTYLQVYVIVLQQRPHTCNTIHITHVLIHMYQTCMLVAHDLLDKYQFHLSIELYNLK